MFIRNFWYLKIQRCVVYLFACQFWESQSRSFKTFWVLTEGLCVRPEGKKTLPQFLQGTNAVRENLKKKKRNAPSLFSYGFALTRTYFGAIEPAAIGEPQRKRRLKIRSASVTSNSICSLVAHDFPYLPSFLFDFSVVILSCMSAMSHEPFSGTPW